MLIQYRKNENWAKFDMKKSRLRSLTLAAKTLLAVARGRHRKPTPITPECISVIRDHCLLLSVVGEGRFCSLLSVNSNLQKLS